MNPTDILVLGLMCLFLVMAWLLGRQTSNLGLMAQTAAATTASREVGWTYERYRLESLRIEWMALPEDARASYCRTWGTPKWALPSHGRPQGKV